MSERVQVEKTDTGRKTEDAAETPAKKDAKGEARRADLRKKGDDLMAELDAVLDDIEDVLVENAQQFVAEYVQKGGQ